MDLDELQAAITRNRTATGQLQGLDEQYERANALRDQQGPEINKYGTVSPLAVIANTMAKSRGRRDARMLAPQREQARTDIASGDAAVANNALALTMAKEGRDVTTAEQATQKIIDDKAQQTIVNDLASRKQQEIEDQTGGDSLLYTNAAGDKLAVTTDVNGGLVQAAGPNAGQPVPEGYYPDKKSGSGSSYVTSMKGSTLDTITEEGNNLRKFNDSVSNFEDRFVQVGGIKTSVLNNLVESASGQDLLEYSKQKDLTKDARDAAQWWANFKMEYELPGRNKIFGATLTDRENASWKEAVLAMRSMKPEDLRRRLAKLQTNLGEDFSNRIGILERAYSDNKGDMAALQFAAEDSGLVYDDETKRWVGAGVTQEYVAPPTPEEVAASIPPGLQATYDGLSDQDKADLATIRDPNVRAQALQEIKNPTALPQAVKKKKQKKGRY